MDSRGVALGLAGGLTLFLGLSGCASGDEGMLTGGTGSSAGTSSAPASSPAESPADSPSENGSSNATESEDGTIEVTVSVRDGKVTPKVRRIKVPLGARVRLQVTSDIDDTVHVHGFEIEEDLAAGRTTTVEFSPDQPGQYVVETHELALELLQLAVR